jgi:hypothetical protein
MLTQTRRHYLKEDKIMAQGEESFLFLAIVSMFAVIVLLGIGIFISAMIVSFIEWFAGLISKPLGRLLRKINSKNL